MCTTHNTTEAFGWPKGTVRGLIAIIICITIVLIMSVLMILFFIKEQYESALGILSVLSGILGSIIGYYFGSRSAETATDTISKMEHEMNEVRTREMNTREINNNQGLRNNMEEGVEIIYNV
jgi:hypothetical protein